MWPGMIPTLACPGVIPPGQFAPSCAAASTTVFQTGNPSWVVPPFPGVTPPTTVVPYSLHRAAWNAPSRPVIPCTTARVDLSTSILMFVHGEWFMVHRTGPNPNSDHEL